MKRVLVIIVITNMMIGCATLTSDAMTPVSLSFSDGSEGMCSLKNKRGSWTANIPETVSIRRSDDALQFDCKNVHGIESVGSIPSSVGGKIIASAVFLDFGITDAITDKHREYPHSFVVPMKKRDKVSQVEQ